MIVRVRGRSMTPTLHPGDVLWVRKTQSLRRGQVVLVHQPDAQLYVKRIVGLPGESVRIRSGRLQINGNSLPEPYVPEASHIQPQSDQTWTLGADDCVLLGDARDDSLDSRRLGPISVKQIVGVAACRFWPRPLMLMFLVLVSSILQAADSGRLLAMATDNRLNMAIGRFLPGHGWDAATEFYTPPGPDDPFTLYTPAGKIAEVVVTEGRSPVLDRTFAGWSALVSRWNSRSYPFAFAVAGTPPLAAVSLEPIPLDNPDIKKIVSSFLKSRNLAVPDPHVNEAYTLPLKDGQIATLLVAHSDESAVTTEQSSPVYAVVLLRWIDQGKEKIKPLVSQTSLKTIGRTQDEQERLYGTRDFYRVLASMDLDGDGWNEIVLYEATHDASQVDIFSFDGRRIKKVLTTYKPNYN